jgi:hypothetical protein
MLAAPSDRCYQLRAEQLADAAAGAATSSTNIKRVVLQIVSSLYVVINSLLT